MKQKLKECAVPLLAVLLISVFPVLFLYFANAGQVDFTEAIPPLMVFSVLGLGAFLLNWLACRSCTKSAITSGIFMLFFSNFSLLEKGMRVLLHEVRYWHTAPIILVVFLHLAFLVLKLVPEQLSRDITKVLCLVFGGLLIFNCITGVPKIMLKQKTERQILQEKKTEKEKITFAAGNNPNIYLLIFDEYAGFHQIKKYYDYDNTVLQNYLIENNFNISYNSHNESIATRTILTNLMNLEYIVDNLTDEKDQERIRKQGKLFSLMREHGYIVSVVETGDYFGQDSPTRNQNTTSAMTAAGEDLAYLCYQKTPIYPFYRLNTSKTLAEILKLSNYLSSKENIPTTPTFRLGYFIFPHVPFLTDENGNALPSSQYVNWKDNKYYLGQYKYATKIIIQILDNILENDPDSIIILQSDHGARANTDYELFLEKFPLEAMNNPLNALYYRGEEFHEIEGRSSVNTLRAVCARLWNESFEELAVPEDIYKYK